MRLKHFHASLVGWEEKDGWITFPLVETSEKEARFKGLVYRLDDDGQLLIDLDMKQGDQIKTERITYRRVE